MYKKLLAIVLSAVMLLLFAAPALAAQPAAAAAKPIEYRMATTSVNVRTGPNSAKYPAIGYLKKGEIVEFVSKSGNWSKIVYNNKTAYVYSKYLSAVPVEYRTATTAVNVRTGPSSVKYPAIGWLKKGEPVQYIGKSGSWSVVVYKGKPAYVFSKYLAVKPDASAKPVKASAENGSLKLELVLNKSVYKANEPIECYATLKNISNRSSIDVYGTRQLVYFPIFGGDFNGEYFTTLELAKTAIQKNKPLEITFVKSGSLSPDADPAYAEKYFADPELRLPPGKYEIRAEMRYSTSIDGNSQTRTLVASANITVTK